MSDVVAETRIVLSAWVPVELADALRERAILEERTVSAEIRRLIKASFNSEAPAANQGSAKTSDRGARHVAA